MRSLRLLAITLLVLAFALLLAAPMMAQAPDSNCVAGVMANVDTVARLHLPGAELYPTQRRSRERLADVARVRCTPVKPDTVRVVYFDTTVVYDTVLVAPNPVPDSIVQEPPVVDSIVVDFNHTTRALWPSGYVGALANGSGSLCAAVVVDGVVHLGDQAIDARIVAQDSVAFTVRAETPTTGLRQLCAPIWDANGLSLLKATPVWPVAWQSRRVTLVDQPVAIPSPLAVIP